MAVKISQREALRLRKRVKALEKQLRDMKSGWGKEWPEGKHLLTFEKGDTMGREDSEVVRTVRLMGHPVVVTEYNGDLHFYGIDL